MIKLSIQILFSASTVVKREQKTNVTNKYGDFYQVNAKMLEDIGFRINIEKIIRPLLNVFERIRISVDGDCSYNKILKTEKLTERVELDFDLAHTLKNVVKHVIEFLKTHLYHGDAEGKIGNANKFRLINYIKNTIRKATKLYSETPDKDHAKVLVYEAWETMKQHCLGNHDSCYEDGENCREEPVFRTYGPKFTQIQLDNFVSDLFDKWLCSEGMFEKIEKFGNTSNLESFHSVFTNRNLWNKSGSLHVATPMFDGITAVASTLFNFGDKETARKMMNLVGWTVLEGNLHALDRAEIKRDSQVEAKIKKKAINKLNRVKTQKQYNNTTKWRDLNPYVPSTQAIQKKVSQSVNDKPVKRRK